MFAARERGDALGGLPELHVGPLGRRDARALLESVLPARLDDQVLERIVAETRGNPLALAGAPARADAGAARGRVRPARRRCRCPPGSRRASGAGWRTSRRDARRLLLLAAADPTGDPALVWRAAQRLGIPESAARALESDGLLVCGAGVVFRHPLVRSAVYRAATADERSEVHRALAEATDPETTPIAAHGTGRRRRRCPTRTSPRSSSVRRRERRRGAASPRPPRSSSAPRSLTPDPPRRAGRALAAAQAKYEAGALDEALTLAANAEAGPLDDVQRAELDVLRARISFAADRGKRGAATAAHAPPSDFEPFDARRARAEIYLDALTAALFAGRLAVGVRCSRGRGRGRAARPSRRRRPRAADLLLDGLARTDHRRAGGRNAGRATGARVRSRADDIGADEGLRWLAWLAGRAAGFIWDYEAWDSLTTRQIRAAREAGALAQLPLALSTRVGVHLFAGEMQAAASLVEEADALAEATGSRIVPPYGATRARALSVAARTRSRGWSEPDTAGLHRPRRGAGAHGVALGDRRSSTTAWRATRMRSRRPRGHRRIRTRCGSPPSRWSSSIEAASRSGRASAPPRRSSS